MVNYLEYEWLQWHRKQLDSDQIQRLEELDHEDERLGDGIAHWWFPIIIGGWFALIQLSGLVFAG